MIVSVVVIAAAWACGSSLRAQSVNSGSSGAAAESLQAMQEPISRVELEVSELKAMIWQLPPTDSGVASSRLMVTAVNS
jgi:hypothetical protein